MKHTSGPWKLTRSAHNNEFMYWIDGTLPGEMVGAVSNRLNGEENAESLAMSCGL